MARKSELQADWVGLERLMAWKLELQADWVGLERLMAWKLELQADLVGSRTSSNSFNEGGWLPGIIWRLSELQ
ncbi:hypothetical protein J4772_32835 [Cohnella sp. LGH]|uniref:hypothetical protein n=1 Tax=Cohnella sp. LGH TaxID=1619153 RepID=UPI001ADC9B46|nr:hypothetical protein [Cohnella sp. LGH]QTH42215.1 hypothetical protein J4772_32835 [Cohnella sp. LGH]